ncbi:MAG: hypothetical protein MJZ99_05710 [Bacteroidales bacterium]|nr:hypothetical protein [Bacteroidales bacterium]
MIESILNLIATEYGKKFAKANRDCNQTITFRPTGGIAFIAVFFGAFTLLLLYILVSGLFGGGFVAPEDIDVILMLIVFIAFFVFYIISALRDLSARVVLDKEKLLVVGAWTPLQNPTFMEKVLWEFKHAYPYGDLEVELEWKDIKSIDYEWRVITITNRMGEVFKFNVNNYSIKIVGTIKTYWTRHGKAIKKR